MIKGLLIKRRKTILKLLFTFNAIIKIPSQMEVTPHYTLLTLLTLGKSMYCSEVHGGAGLGFGPASAHYIAEQV